MENPLNEEEKKKLLIIVIIGNICAGTSDFIYTITKNRTIHKGLHNIGVYSEIVRLNIDNEQIPVLLSNTEYQDKFSSLSPVYFRKAKGFIFMFNTSYKDSFENLKKWYLSAKQQEEYPIQSMIIGNNRTINNKPREVDKGDVYQLAKKYNDLYYEIDKEYDSNILYYVKDLVRRIIAIQKGRELPKVLCNKFTLMINKKKDNKKRNSFVY